MQTKGEKRREGREGKSGNGVVISIRERQREKERETESDRGEAEGETGEKINRELAQFNWESDKKQVSTANFFSKKLKKASEKKSPAMVRENSRRKTNSIRFVTELWIIDFDDRTIAMEI